MAAAARVMLAISTGLVAGAWLPRAAAAQVSIVQDLPPRFEWRGRLETDFRTEFKTRTAGGDSFETWQVGVGGDFGGPINESILVGIRGTYRFTSWNFRLDNPPGVPSVYGGSELPRDPWGDINTVDLAPNMTILIGDHFSLVTAVPIRFSAETGARENALTAGISTILRWQITDDIRLGAGIGVTSQLEDGAETFPLLSVDWQIMDSMRLQTQGSWIQGGNVMLLWGANPSVRLTLSAGYERNRFRLDDNGIATDRDGVGEVTSVPIEVGLRLRLYQGAYFDFRVGLGVAGQLRVENSKGDKLYQEDYDPSPRIGLGLTLPFGLP